MSSFSPQFVKRIVGKIFPTLRKTQLVNVSFGIYGQITSQSSVMSQIVRNVPGASKHKHRLKRFFRFLSNPRVKPERVRLHWVAWCLSTFTSESLVIPVALDWTTLPGNIQCLMIALPFHGRAIPLLWQLVLYRDIKDSQNMIEERLVARVVNLVRIVAPEKHLLLTADRGFGRATFFLFLLKKQVHFVIRVKGDVTITTHKGKRLILRTFGKTLTPNLPQWFEEITYRSDGIVTGISLAAVVAEPEKGKTADPWFLVTNLTTADAAITRYHERFHIEEWFKDMKHQLGIAGMQTKNLMRVRRLLFLTCVAYGILMVVGSLADSEDALRERLITGGRKVASRIWFAIHIIHDKLLGKPFWQNVYLRSTVP